MLNCLAALTVVVPATAPAITWQLDSEDEATHTRRTW